MKLLVPIVREAYRRELVPDRIRWHLAAGATLDWYRAAARGLRAEFGEGSRAVVAEVVAETLGRRYEALRAAHSWLSDRTADPRGPARLFGALYRLSLRPRASWVLDGLGGAPRGLSEHLRGERALLRLSARARWEEVTVHLGESLIVMTERLSARMEHVRKRLGDICFEMGARYGRRIQRAFGLPEGGDRAAQAIEVLRISEYIFRVNPEHWGGTDLSAGTGWLEGTACPWYPRPGWNGGHCGIFGQFQAGVCSVFGLRYHLSRTIPKHGGSTCRVDLKPIPLRRAKDGLPLG
ncbi:MAG TPA: hypothetical protein VIK91_07380 [Nannocystis sp.]